MKIKSTLLEEELEIEVIEKEGDSYISHKALKSLLNNIIKRDDVESFEEKKQVTCNDFSNSYIVTETMKIVYKGKTISISEIGEASQENCSGEINHQFMASCASKRAFDRALIRLLGIGNFYSIEEFYHIEETYEDSVENRLKLGEDINRQYSPELKLPPITDNVSPTSMVQPVPTQSVPVQSIPIQPVMQQVQSVQPTSSILTDEDDVLYGPCRIPNSQTIYKVGMVKDTKTWQDYCQYIVSNYNALTFSSEDEKAFVTKVYNTYNK